MASTASHDTTGRLPPDGTMVATRQPGGAASATRLAKEAAVVLAAQGLPWRVECPATDGEEQTRDQEIPGGVQLILLLGELGHLQPALQRVRDLTDLDRTLPPIIVLLWAEPGGAVTPTSVTEAQRALTHVRADDVLLMPVSSEELRLAVTISLQRIELERASAALRQQWFEEQMRNLWQVGSNQLFWPIVHMVFPAFPQMQPANSKQPGPGTHVGSCFLESCIGTGTLATVYSATNQETGQSEAVKIVPKSRLQDLGQVQCLWKEINLLSSLRHNNVVQLNGVVHARDYLYLHMEMAGRRNLYKAIKESGGVLPRQQAKDFGAQLASGVAHCHSSNVAHRDLKPENVVVSEDSTLIKIVDFGCAVRHRGNVCSEICGTMPFMAPEMLARETYDASAIDVWASGVLLLEMHCGIDKLTKMLGWGHGITPHIERFYELQQFFSEPDRLPSHLESDLGSEAEGLVWMLCGMLQIAPARRWTAAQAVAAARE